MAQTMKADQVAMAPAPIDASARAQTPSATRPNIGASVRLMFAKRRTMAAEWLGTAAGCDSARRARRISRIILRRRAAASGSARPPLPCSLDSTMPARRRRPWEEQLKLYNSNVAPNPRRVRIFLAEKGLSIPQVQVDLGKLEHKTPEFAALSPFQVIPALELDDGTVIGESIA